MNETALGQFWELLGWVLALNAEAFRQLNALPQGSIVVLIVVLSAGLSEAIAHSVILFANRVQPARFLFSLFISAILFAFGYLFLVFSTWLISFAPFTAKAPFGVLARTLGFGYAPLIFSVFGAMPYFGGPILSILSLWQLLAMVVGLAAVSSAHLWQAFVTVALGWMTLWVLQRTLGQPIVRLAHWIACQAAGVELITKRRKLRGFFQAIQISAAATSAPANRPTSKKATSSRYRFRNIVGSSLGLLVLFIGTLIAAILLAPIRQWWFAWYDSLEGSLALIFDLVWIGIIAVVATALMAPLEALSWWAGWQGGFSDIAVSPETNSETNSEIDPASATTESAAIRTATRYVIYLDGINQSEFEHTPDVQVFFNAIAPVLPEDIVLIESIMSYSVRNRPLTTNRPLAFLWRWVDSLRDGNPASVFGYFVNIRNAWVVAVSADKRYGPIYNLGIARVVYRALQQHGYQIDSGVPVTLIGFSGGGQMAIATAPLLREALRAPIEVVSLGGVLSGNINILKLAHLYHLSGDKDLVERIGPVMFPKRWPVSFLSYWNRAKRMGKVSLISLGPVGHRLPGGIMDPNQRLPDGRTHLQQTIDFVMAILLGGADSKSIGRHLSPQRKLSNYERYRAIAPNRPETYPVQQSVSLERYRAIAPWMGRLILPAKDQRQTTHDVLFEVHHAPDSFQHLVGQVVTLRLSGELETRAYVRAVTKDIHFSPQAEASVRQGKIHPTRLNHWRMVNPLESLAGAHPVDDVMVMLPPSVTVRSAGKHANSTLSHVLCTDREPVQITGRYYGLVKFIQPSAELSASESDLFEVVHFNLASRAFDGPKETVKVPHIPANDNNTQPSTISGIEKTPLNETGWYIYGAQDSSGDFVVQALAPRALLRAEPDRAVTEKRAAKTYFKQAVWHRLTAKKGTISSVLLSPDSPVKKTPWAEGQRALVIHVYGGVGGNKAEPAAQAPLYFGHFAYGIAEVVCEPLTGELRFEIIYHQVYTHNSEGLIAGSLHWSRYMGDRAFGFLGLRPVVDTLITLDEFTGDYGGEGGKRSPLDRVMYELEIMAARYRIGDGTGATFVGPANNCDQDANQALYAALRYMSDSIRTAPDIEQWKQQHPDQAQKLEQLEQLTADFKELLLPWGTARADWKNRADALGSTLEDHPIQNLIRGLTTWRTLLPRLTSDEVTEAFLQKGGAAWILQTTQVGGFDPDIEPVAPMTL
ncbi:MAG: CAAX protease [Phormidesmis sp.]